MKGTYILVDDATVSVSVIVSVIENNQTIFDRIWFEFFDRKNLPWIGEDVIVQYSNQLGIGIFSINSDYDDLIIFVQKLTTTIIKDSYLHDITSNFFLNNTIDLVIQWNILDKEANLIEKMLSCCLANN